MATAFLPFSKCGRSVVATLPADGDRTANVVNPRDMTIMTIMTILARSIRGQ